MLTPGHKTFKDSICHNEFDIIRGRHHHKHVITDLISALKSNSEPNEIPGYRRGSFHRLPLDGK